MVCLFLDRDGVLNHRIAGDYVRNRSQWEWLPMAKEAFVLLGKYFDTIVIVSNQQGVGKGYFSLSDLSDLTEFFVAEIQEIGGKIDKVYYCPHLKSDNCTCRKPKIGMAVQAKVDFPTIDFTQSILLGDSLSDLEFGKNLGMKTVFIATEQLPPNWQHCDATYPSLWDFALAYSVLSM